MTKSAEAKLGKGAGAVVAGDVSEAVSALDGAMLSQARLVVSTLEAARGAGIPIADTQKIFRALSSGLNSVVDGRQEMVAAVRHMNAVKRRSDIRMEDFGCPDGWAAIPGLLTGAAADRIDA